ncbi:MBL fold metallo-hydrolase [Pikeienuella sp. HZG-20]|uniref:MBL fold metallo-hydrolase n=1 Tax=Paludibacillus litoralis TaxID=3133267 RepID=UPI0030EBD5C0
MIFYWAETPDGWGVPGIHGPLAGDELDGYVQSGVYLIRGQGENILIDTGNWTTPEYDNGMGKFLIDKLDQETNDLRYILITHFHYDHTGNASILKERYGAEIVAHPLDKPIIEDPMLVTKAENVERFGVSPEEVLRDFNLAPNESLGLSDPEIVRRHWNRPVEVDVTVEGGDILDVGGLKLEILHLPGHCPGQVGVYNPHTGSLYSADIMHFPTPLGPAPIGDAKAHRASIESCIRIKPQLLLEGHGLSAYSEASSMRRLEHMIRQQDDMEFRVIQVLARAGKPMTILELVPEVMPVKSEIDYAVSTGVGMRRCYAECCLQTHLILQIEKGRAERVTEDGLVKFTATNKGREWAAGEFEARLERKWS